VQVVQRARDAQHHAVAMRVPAEAPVVRAVLCKVARQRGVQVAAGHVLSAHGNRMALLAVKQAENRYVQHMSTSPHLPLHKQVCSTLSVLASRAWL